MWSKHTIGTLISNTQNIQNNYIQPLEQKSCQEDEQQQAIWQGDDGWEEGVSFCLDMQGIARTQSPSRRNCALE